MKRCSAELMRNSPPNDHQAWPPKFTGGSCSMMSTRLPASTSSAAATSPARPAPTTIASACADGASLGTGRVASGCAGIRKLLRFEYYVHHDSGREGAGLPGVGRQDDHDGARRL